MPSCRARSDGTDEADAEPELVVDHCKSPALEVGQAVAHGLELLGRMPHPVRDLANYSHWFAGAKGAGRIAGKFLVGHVRIIFEGPGRLDDINSLTPISFGQSGGEPRATAA